MDNKKVNVSSVVFYAAVSIGAISILGGLTYFARRLWYDKPVLVDNSKSVDETKLVDNSKSVDETPVSLELLEQQNIVD
jgi:hypothetical protein